MKTERNILVAFILNLSFTIFEIIGGIITGSVAILSDAVHDFGDAMSIGISYFLEKKSKKKANTTYTYGYARFSILGAFITTTILAVGSILVIYEAIKRIFNPITIDYNGMIIFAIFGVVINFLAAYFTKEGDSINQKSVNLHMLEDVLGWVIVLIGSILMRFTDISKIDSLMSIGVALFILINTFKNFKEILDLFLVKTPSNIDIDEIKEHLLKIKGVDDVHHIHIWSLDGENNYATMHVVTKSKDIMKLKHLVREEMEEEGIVHTTIEIENEVCDETECVIKNKTTHHHHNH